MFTGFCASSFAQSLPQTPADALHEMTRLAGVIFTGQVTAIRKQPGAGGATGVVEIDFAVEDAVRGVTGPRYTVREWAGLWAADDMPFRAGQRYLMLLHTPGASGLSSPVGGMDGAIPIRGAGAAVGPDQAAGAFAGGTGSAQVRLKISSAARAQQTAAPPDGRVIDLRWVGARVVRPVSYRSVEKGRPTMVIGRSDEASTAAGQAVAPGASATQALQSALKSSAYADVLGMIRGWQEADHAAQ